MSTCPSVGVPCHVGPKSNDFCFRNLITHPADIPFWFWAFLDNERYEEGQRPKSRVNAGGHSGAPAYKNQEVEGDHAGSDWSREPRLPGHLSGLYGPGGRTLPTRTTNELSDNSGFSVLRDNDLGQPH